MRSVFIILSTIHIGGAEKRFAGLWNSFLQKREQNSFNLFLILNPALYEKFVDAEILIRDHPNVIVEKLSEKNFLTYRANVKRAIKKYSRKGDIIHFIGYTPFLFIFSRKTLLSVTYSNINVEGLKAKWIVYVSLLLSGSADILDSGVYKKLRKLFFWKRNNMYKTSNSFCDTELYTPALLQKKNWIVFLGRFSPVKQVLELLRAIPLIHAELKKQHEDDFHFFILGHGELEEALLHVKRNAAFENIKIDIYYEKFPFTILNQSKVFLSLQVHNNYPSRSLLEAMAAGNIPLVTDNGETRTIAKPEFSFYVPEKFSAEQLAREMVNIFAMNDAEFSQKAALARNEVISGHTIVQMKNYYQMVYENIFSK